MRFIALIVAIFIFLSTIQAQDDQKYSLSGVVMEASTGETLPGAAVIVSETGASAITNLYGFYSLQLPAGDYTIIYKFVGFENSSQSVSISSDTKLDVELSEEAIQLKEAKVSSRRLDQNVTAVEMSSTELDIEEIKKIPAFLGEVDVIKSIQLLPGVTTVGEGASGFNVRGGSIDQNLVLLDEATVFSSSHLLGFFSVFNSDAIKDVKLYKGGIPAQYGGRISSVLDVRQKEGNMKRFSGRGGIGFVSSRLTLEGPIVKDKGSFIIAGRRSYADVFLRMSNNDDINENIAYFYDLNAKANYKLNDNNRLFLSGYFGRDVFKFGEAFGFDWGNTTSTLRWNHIFNDKVFLNLSGIYSNYDYSLGGPDFFVWTSRIQNYNIKADFNYYHNEKHKIDFGVQGTWYQFYPGKVEPKGDFVGVFDGFEIDVERALETAVYVSDEYKLNSRITILGGLRYGTFMNVGKATSFVYEDGKPLSEETIIDTVDYSSGEIVKFYHGFEPRLSVKFGLDSVSSIKASYMRTRQNLQLVSNTTSGLPLDLWKASDQFISPVIGDQIAAGYFRNFRNNTIEGSVELYYKWMQNVLDYKDEAELFLNEVLETELLSGKGRAYGLEFMMRKKSGRATGWLSYTLAKTERLVDGEFDEERINSGDWYPSNYDKRHDVTFVAAYDITDRLNCGMNFTYSTGRPVTFPDGKYEYGGLVIPNYSSRNQERIPDYHRLDLSATWQFKDKKTKVEEKVDAIATEEQPKKKLNIHWEHSLTLSIYNVYARKNAYSISFEQSETDPTQTEISRLSILGTVLPALTYNFNF